jgi:hypothetical protein
VTGMQFRHHTYPSVLIKHQLESLEFGCQNPPVMSRPWYCWSTTCWPTTRLTSRPSYVHRHRVPSGNDSLPVHKAALGHIRLRLSVQSDAGHFIASIQWISFAAYMKGRQSARNWSGSLSPEISRNSTILEYSGLSDIRTL